MKNNLITVLPSAECDGQIRKEGSTHTSFKVKRSRSPGPLMLTHIVRHIFRTTRPTNFKLVTRMEDSYLTVPGLPVPAPPVPQSAEY